MLAGAVVEVREQVMAVIQAAADLDCACQPDAACLACRAKTVLERITQVGFRMVRWRNPPGPTVRVVHTAGPVINSREYRRSCPGYIVDRRQACTDCGEQLIRGRWALFFDEGDRVAVLPSRIPRRRDVHRWSRQRTAR
jgi:hypothetical protein